MVKYNTIQYFRCGSGHCASTCELLRNLEVVYSRDLKAGHHRLQHAGHFLNEKKDECQRCLEASRKANTHASSYFVRRKVPMGFTTCEQTRYANDVVVERISRDLYRHLNVVGQDACNWNLITSRNLIVAGVT